MVGEKANIGKARGFFLGILLSILCSCTVGPRYKPVSLADESWKWKKQELTDSTFNNVQERPKMATKIPDNWWSVFDDDTLNQLVQKALDANPNLRTSLYRIAESRSLLTQAKANYYPILSIDPYANKTQLSGNRPNQISTNSLPSLQLTTIAVPLDLSYEIDVWGKYRNAVRGAQANVQATQADYEVVKLSLASDVASNYMMLRFYDAQIDLFIRSLQLRKENLNLVKEQYKAGLISQLDVSQAEIEMNTVESQLSEAKRNRTGTENAISLLCGSPSTSFAIVPQNALPKTPLIPLEVPSELVQRRPDIVEVEQQLIYANAQIGVANAAFFPSIKLSGSAGYLSSRIDNLFSTHSTTWLGGVNVSIPIFTGGRNIGAKAAAEARVNETRAMYEQRVLTALKEVQDALINVERRAEQIAIQQRAVQSSQKAAQISKELYKAGLTTYINVVVADRSVLDAQNTLLNVSSQQLLYSVYLIKAMGGGWK
jgi:multidrug efflux system outer membrane protein